MKTTDPLCKEEAGTREDPSKLNEEQLDDCENGMLKSLDETMTFANESLSQKDYQKLIADYYFGEFNTHAKLLYFQIMGMPRRYG
jgi:hypothetical protein